MEDYGGNVLFEQITILIQFINDNDPSLFLDGTSGLQDYEVYFFEGQDRLNGAVPVTLSDNLVIADEDAGPQTFVSANIAIINSE